MPAPPPATYAFPMSWPAVHPVVRGLLRGGGFLVLALVAMQVLHDVAHWYPRSLGDYQLTAVLTAIGIGVGRRFPYTLLVVVAAVVGSPVWYFRVVDVRLLPLALAAYLAGSAGVRLVVALPIVTVAALSGAFPFWLHIAPGELLDAVKFDDLSTKVLSYGLIVAALLLGRAAWRQRRSEDTLRRRNEELVRLRESDQERIATEERTTIAREVHDVVAHHLAAIVIRAQAAAHVGDRRPDELRDTVGWIAESGQEALTEMRRVVRVLRGTDQSGGTTEAPVELSTALDDAVRRVRSTGIDVESEVRVPAGLSPIQDFALLRVCQEALTNVLIHSDAASVRVELAPVAGDASVRLVVDDDGAVARAGTDHAVRAGSFGSGGAGLRGMRERAASVHGRLSAGPTDRGWRVELVVPLESAGPTPTRTTAPASAARTDPEEPLLR
jgi:signal transduction histidine kinase